MSRRQKRKDRHLTDKDKDLDVKGSLRGNKPLLLRGVRGTISKVSFFLTSSRGPLYLGSGGRCKKTEGSQASIITMPINSSEFQFNPEGKKGNKKGYAHCYPKFKREGLPPSMQKRS